MSGQPHRNFAVPKFLGFAARRELKAKFSRPKRKPLPDHLRRQETVTSAAAIRWGRWIS